MTVSSWHLLILQAFFFTGKPCEVGGNHYTAVRWLSGQHYAQTHHVHHQSEPLPPPTALTLARAGVRVRPLFSWDLPVELKTTTEGIPQSTPMDVFITTEHQSKNYKRKNSIESHPKNVWWPWKNYKEWLGSRVRNNKKYFEESIPSKMSIKPKVTLTKLKRKHKKKSQRNNHTKKHKNKKLKPSSKVAKEIINLLQNTTSNKKNNTHTLNDTNCIMMNKEQCKGLLISNHIFKYKETLSQSDGANKNDYKKLNGIRSSTENINPLKSIDLKQPVLFMSERTNSRDSGNECLKNNGGCEGLCLNFLGSFRCHCPPGFRLDSSGKKCLDINECIARNGHGPCQGDCTNTWGSYHCSCANLTGTKLANDRHSCEDIDECISAANSLGCSHGCINTVGTAFCLCPDGYELASDWRTCQDIDECDLIELQNEKCFRTCVNTVGSYKCF